MLLHSFNKPTEFSPILFKSEYLASGNIAINLDFDRHME